MTARGAQLARVCDDLRAASAHAARLAAGATDAAWRARPANGGWSAAECVAHLTLTTKSYLPLLDAAAALVPGNAPLPDRYARGLVPALLEWSLEPPARMRSKTLAQFVPPSDAPKGDTLAAFEMTQRALIDWITAHEHLALNRVILTSPFNARLKYNAYAAFRILTAHERRHLWQAERALRGAL